MKGNNTIKRIIKALSKLQMFMNYQVLKVLKQKKMSKMKQYMK